MFSYGPAMEAAREVVDFFCGIEKRKVEFAEWEQPLIERTAVEFPHWNSFARDPQIGVSAALIGGEALGMGSISHLAVTPSCRGCGLGSAIVVETLNRAQSCTTATRVHLIVTEGNERALAFWKTHGFEVADEPIAELTVADPVPIPPADDCVQELDAEAVERLRHSCPSVNDRLTEREWLAILSELRLGKARAWSVSERGAPVGVLFSASLGVRGVIRLLLPEGGVQLDAATAMLSAGIAHISAMGVKRMHCFPTNAFERKVLSERGFTAIAGETTMIRALPEPQ